GLGTLLAGLAVVAVLAVSIEHVSAVALGALALLTIAAFEAVAPLPAAAQHLGACAAAAQRLEELTDAPVPVADPPAPRPLPTASGAAAPPALAAHGVTVAFAGLDRVDLELRPGRAVAITGPSGC